jgi:hypothetical protein
VLYGLLGGTALGIEPRYRVGSLDSGALFCKAYEAYTELHAPAAISFEHAWFLLLALAARRRARRARCAELRWRAAARPAVEAPHRVRELQCGARNCAHGRRICSAPC